MEVFNNYSELEKYGDIKKLPTYFKPELDRGKYKDISENIKSYFDNDYLKFVQSIKDPLLKEVVVLMRKYQSTFEKLMINGDMIFNTTYSSFMEKPKDSAELSQYLSGFILDKMNSNCLNTFKILMSLTPKVSKEELQLVIDDDIIEVLINFSVLVEPNKVFKVDQSKTIFVITNQKRLDFESRHNHTLKAILEQKLNEFIMAAGENFLNGVNKFLTYFENFLPHILKQANQLNTQKSDVWTQAEQILLEKGLIVHQNEKDLSQKFIKVGLFVGTKSGKQCLARYKEIANKMKNEIKSPNEKKEEADKLEVMIAPVVPKQISVSQVSKIVESKESIYSFIPEEVNLVADSIRSIVSEIESEFTIFLADLQKIRAQKLLQTEQELLKLKKMNLSEYSQASNQEVVEAKRKEREDDFQPDIDADEDYQCEDDTAKAMKKRIFHVRVKNPLEYKFEQFFSQKEHLEQIILLSKCISVLSDGMSFYNYGLIYSSNPLLYVTCEKCKKMKYEATTLKLSTNPIFYYHGAICLNCGTHIYIIVKPDLIHESNKTFIAKVFTLNAIVIDYLPSGIEGSCTKCLLSDYDNGIKFKQVTPVKSYSAVCSNCTLKIEFNIGRVYINSGYSSAKTSLSLLDNYSNSSFFSYITTFIESSFLYVSNYYKIGRVGTALPDNGTCTHYKNSYRWFRFGCCFRLYPCDLCHNKDENHEMIIAKTVACGFCSFEQKEGGVICTRCGKEMIKNKEQSQFWEGGKGQTDKSKMSSKDGHKFTGLNKTKPSKAK